MNSLYKLIFIWFAVLIFACGKQSPNTGKLTFTVKDDLNRNIEFQTTAQRVISLAPSITETLFALDDGKSLLAVTDYCDYPQAAKMKISVGGMITPNFEKIAELKPGLIIMTVEGNNQDDFNKLRNLGYKIFITRPKDIDGIYKSILDLGKIIGADSSAETLIHSMRQRQEKVIQSKGGIRNSKVLTVISLQPLICAGKNTFINELIGMAGGINIAANAPMPYPILNREEVLKQNPDIIIAMDDAVRNADEMLRFFPEWKKLNAFRQKKVFIVEGDILSRPGPRIIDGLEVLARIVNN